MSRGLERQGTLHHRRHSCSAALQQRPSPLWVSAEVVEDPALEEHGCGLQSELGKAQGARADWSLNENGAKHARGWPTMVPAVRAAVNARSQLCDGGTGQASETFLGEKQNWHGVQTGYSVARRRESWLDWMGGT